MNVTDALRDQIRATPETDGLWPRIPWNDYVVAMAFIYALAGDLGWGPPVLHLPWMVDE